MKKLRVAVVGCGDIAGYTAWFSRLVPQITLCACCDLNAGRAQTFAKRHGIPQVFIHYPELLTKAGAEVVYLAVPHHLHAEMILAAAAENLPVLVEKPFTRTYSEALNLTAALRGQKIGVNYQYRYDQGCFALARAVQAGSLGKIHSIRINVPWRREQTYFDAAPWHKTLAQAGGGTLITQGSHFLDIALWALGKPPIAAVGAAASPGFAVEVETLAHGIVETAAGTLINITSSMVAAVEQAVTIEVYGELGTAVYRDRPFPSVRYVGVSVRKQPPPGWGVHALQRSLAGFAHWVLDGAPFLTPAESTLPVLAAVDAIYRSAQTGRRESITQPLFDNHP